MTNRSHFTVVRGKAHGELPRLTWTLVAGSSPANMRVILGSPKGGCGKTSLTVFKASKMAELGVRVLLVEITEGQAPLTQNYAYGAVETGEGIGVHLHRLIGHAKLGESYQQAYARLKPLALKEAPEALATLRRVGVSPSDEALGFDFMPCGESNLAELSTSPKMQDRSVRRALFAAFFDALAEAKGGGWDVVLLDVLPSAESVIVKAAMGVADSYALIVDMESAAPLPGWGVLYGELQEVMAARAQEGQDPNIFRGMILNKVQPKKPGLTRKINRLMVNLKIAQAREAEMNVPVLAEVKNMSTLALLGFNFNALQQLSASYNGAIPEDLDELSEEDIQRLVLFEAGQDASGNSVGVRTGTQCLAKLFPSTRKTLEQESYDLLPMLLDMAGEQEALAAFVEAYQDAMNEEDAHVR